MTPRRARLRRHPGRGVDLPSVWQWIAARGKAGLHQKRAGSRPRRAKRDRKRAARRGKAARGGSIECHVPPEKSRAPRKKSRVPTKKSHARHCGVSSTALPVPRSARKAWWLALEESRAAP